MVEAVPIHGTEDVLYVVYFCGRSKGFWDEAAALAFAQHVADWGWDEDWQPERVTP